MAGLIQLVIGAQNAGALSGLKQVEGQLQAFAQRAAGALGAAFGAGAILEFTRRAIDAADAIGKLAQKTGTAIQAMSGLGAVAAADVVSLQELQIGLKGLSEWMVKTGQAGRDTTEVLLEQADLFARMPDGAQKVSLAMDRFGRAGQNMIPFLNKGSEAIREQVKEAEELGAVVGPAFAKSAEQFNDNQHRVGLVVQGFFNQIAKELLPGLNKMLEWFVEFAKRSDGFKPIIETIVIVFKTLAIAATAVAGSFAALGTFLGEFGGVLSVTGDPFEAWAAGAKAAEAEMSKMDAVIDAINTKVQESDDKARGKGEGAPAAGSMLETQQTFLAHAQLRAAKIAGDATRTQADKNVILRGIYKEQLEAIEGIQAELQKRAQAELVAGEDGVRVTQEYLAIQGDVLAMQKQRFEVSQKLHAIEADTSFVTRMRDNLRLLSDEWTNFARNLADTLTQGLKTAIDGVTNSIMAAIEGTQSWGKAFYQAGRQIIASLISITLQYVAGKLAMMVVDSIFAAKSKKDSASTTAASVPAGIAKAGEQGGWVGILIYIAVFAAAIAAIMGIVGAIAGFAEGGVIRGGEQIIRVNERGQEAILNAQALSNVGEGFVAGLNAGLPIHQAAAVSPAAPSIKNNQQVNVAMFNSQAAMEEWLRNHDGRAVVVDIVKSEIHNITGRS